MDSNERIVELLPELYEKDLLEEVKLHWKSIVAPENEYDFYKWQSKQIPWFGDLEAWAGRIFSSKKVPAVFEKFPKSVHKYSKETAAELDFLFPSKELTTAFLPVVLTSYCIKRKHPPKSSETSSREFINKLFGRNSTSPKETVRYSIIKNHLTLPEIHQKYKKMNSDNIDFQNTARTLAMYSTPVLFLFFLTKVSDNCNVSWSFYVFEHMTKSLHLLGSDAEALLEKLSGECSSDGNVLQYDPLRNEILELAESIINDAWEAPKDGTSQRFLFFLRRAKEEFAEIQQSPIDFECDDFLYWVQKSDESLLDTISPEDARRSMQPLIARYMELGREYDALLRTSRRIAGKKGTKNSIFPKIKRKHLKLTKEMKKIAEMIE